MVDQMKYKIMTAKEAYDSRLEMDRDGISKTPAGNYRITLESGRTKLLSPNDRTYYRGRRYGGKGVWSQSMK